MKIVRAMKERSRLEGEIKDIKHRMQNCINAIDGNDYTESYDDLYRTLIARLMSLTGIKSAVLKANIDGGMFNTILLLGELKSYLVFLKELDPKVGKQEPSYRETVEVYKSQMTVKDKLEAVQKTQKEINRITDLLDEFNAKTDIGEIEEVVLPLPRIDCNF